MSVDSREILEILSRSDSESHPRLLQFLACRLGFTDNCSNSHPCQDDSIPESYVKSVESLEKFLSNNFDNREDWLHGWWSLYVLPEFVTVLFECTLTADVGAFVIHMTFKICYRYHSILGW